MDIDEDGWPLASVESLWAVDLGDDTVRLDNTPWFVRGVASGDIIKVELDDEGILWAGDTVQPSQNCTIRLIVLKDEGSAATRQSVLKVELPRVSWSPVILFQADCGVCSWLRQKACSYSAGGT
ncbi:DUF4265 domain-containing protein [Streptomyces chengmaiensis]|nr:DUF4265 domain-containing protein [Streptomyces chengmaiensis]